MASDDSPYAPKPRPTKWLFFEDMVPGTVNTSSCTYTANKKEMMDFARKWDPLDMHTDETLAAASPMKCLTASSRYTMAVSSWLLNRADPMIRVTAMFGMEAVRLPRPVLPGDVLSIYSTVLEQGQESSKRRDQRALRPRCPQLLCCSQTSFRC